LGILEMSRIPDLKIDLEDLFVTMRLHLTEEMAGLTLIARASLYACPLMPPETRKIDTQPDTDNDKKISSRDYCNSF
jgi:hypothetical protein